MSQHRPVLLFVLKMGCANLFLLEEYEVAVVTGDQKGAGTDANVSLTIFGKNGNSPKLALKNNSKSCFERNQTDMFLLKTQCCGPLDKIRCVYFSFHCWQVILDSSQSPEQNAKNHCLCFTIFGLLQLQTHGVRSFGERRKIT